MVRVAAAVLLRQQHRLRADGKYPAPVIAVGGGGIRVGRINIECQAQQLVTGAYLVENHTVTPVLSQLVTPQDSVILTCDIVEHSPRSVGILNPVDTEATGALYYHATGSLNLLYLNGHKGSLACDEEMLGGDGSGIGDIAIVLNALEIAYCLGDNPLQECDDPRSGIILIGTEHRLGCIKKGKQGVTNTCGGIGGLLAFIPDAQQVGSDILVLITHTAKLPTIKII